MIQVERLVFDVPGLGRERAERLARRIGAMLASAAPDGGGAQSGEADKVDVLLPLGREASDEAILAALAAALRARA